VSVSVSSGFQLEIGARDCLTRLRRPLRVASVPASHVYVRHLATPFDAGAVVRLRDPVPKDGARVPGGWWPPVMLDPDWLMAHRDDFDLVHVQFGFDTKTAGELGRIVDCLRDLKKPLVYTVHDLRNPHHPEAEPHDAGLDVLIGAADLLVTLTSGAARVIEDRWGRRPVVLPHPHVVDFVTMRRPRPRRPCFVIGVHVKSRRANMDPLPVIDATLSALEHRDMGRLRVDVHDEIFDPASHWFDPDLGRALVQRGRHPALELFIHPYFSDAELWDYLHDIDVSVLPYRFGTHSGWLEACYDLGTVVVAPDCGFYAQQRPCLQYRHSEQRIDAESLADAVTRAYVERPSWQASRRDRWTERLALAEAHRQLYSAVLA
jgi:hypothetical protein